MPESQFPTPNGPDPQDEYRRALRDYTQLMRHRLANPLTTIISGIATLRGLPDMEPDAREALLALIAERAADLERVALFPVTLQPEETMLVPLAAFGADGPERRSLIRQRRKGMNEAQFRRINDILAELSAVPAVDMVDFVCECSDSTCAATIQLTIAEYHEVHDQMHFVIEPRHDDPQVEDVVSRTSDWWTVAKRGIAGRQAASMQSHDDQLAVDAADAVDAAEAPASPPSELS